MQPQADKAELKPGEARLLFATPEEEQEYRRLRAEIDANPESFADYAWEEVDEV